MKEEVCDKHSINFMSLGIYIGNTTIYFGIISNDKVKKFRILIDKTRIADEYVVIIKK